MKQNICLIKKRYQKWNIHLANDSTHQGKWEKPKFLGTELKGKVLGIVGYGNIGQRVAEICSTIGMKIITNSKSASDDDLSKFNVERSQQRI